MRRFGRLLWLVPMLLLLAAAPAAARDCQAPPGTAAIDHSCEWIPRAGGSRAESPARLGPPSPTTATLLAIRRAGADGQALAAFLEHSAAARASSGASAEAPGSAAAKARGPDRPGAAAWGGRNPTGPFSALTASAHTGAVVGRAFGWLFLGATLAALCGLWLRHRPRGSGRAAATSAGPSAADPTG